MKIFNKFKGTIDTAARKSQDALEINKLNNQIKKHEAEIDKYYQQIGEKVYQDPKLENPESQNDVQAKVKSIEYVLSQIHNLRRKILFLRDQIECDSCNLIVPINTKFCPDCGRNMTELSQTIMKILAVEEHANKD